MQSSKAFTVMQKELACMGISMALKTVAEDDEDIVRIIMKKQLLHSPTPPPYWGWREN
jgi:hypothetical protein